MPAEQSQPPAPEAPEAPDARRLADRLLAALAGLDLTSADGRAGIGTLLSDIERACPGAILQQAAGIQLRALGWENTGGEPPAVTGGPAIPDRQIRTTRRTQNSLSATVSPVS